MVSYGIGMLFHVIFYIRLISKRAQFIPGENIWIIDRTTSVALPAFKCLYYFVTFQIEMMTEKIVVETIKDFSKDST